MCPSEKKEDLWIKIDTDSPDFKMMSWVIENVT